MVPCTSRAQRRSTLGIGRDSDLGAVLPQRDSEQPSRVLRIRGAPPPRREHGGPCRVLQLGLVSRTGLSAAPGIEQISPATTATTTITTTATSYVALSLSPGMPQKP